MADEAGDLSVTRVVRSPDPFDDPTSDRRRQLWRDSATILIGVVIALLAAQTFMPGTTGVPTGTSSDLPTQVAIGTFGPPISLEPGDTLPPILPSIDIDASPTPIPVITMGPSPTPAPSDTAGPSVRPSPGTTPRPTRTPTPTVSGKPGGTPVPTTASPPTANFSWVQSGLTTTVNFTDQSTGAVDSWSWVFGGGGTSSARNPSHDFGAPGVYEVTLTVSGPGGQSQIKKNVTVVGV